MRCSGAFSSRPAPRGCEHELTPLTRRGNSHEIAYVFGQLSSPHSVPSLVTVLRKADEEDMVRHEAAEALGGIATDECLPVLEEMAKKEGVPRVVRESCEVALDMVRSSDVDWECVLTRPSSLTAVRVRAVGRLALRAGAHRRRLINLGDPVSRIPQQSYTTHSPCNPISSFPQAGAPTLNRPTDRAPRDPNLLKQSAQRSCNWQCESN